jgi:hypothetical protein
MTLTEILDYLHLPRCMYMPKIQSESNQSGFGTLCLMHMMNMHLSNCDNLSHITLNFSPFITIGNNAKCTCLRSKLIPISHRPNWNDVRIVRAILSLLENALRNEKTTHVLLCTESCIPVATLKETARSVLLNEICPWEEAEEGTDGHHQQKECPSNRPKKNLPRGRLYWNQSYVDCYDRNSSRCTRFDERECRNRHPLS